MPRHRIRFLALSQQRLNSLAVNVAVAAGLCACGAMWLVCGRGRRRKTCGGAVLASKRQRHPGRSPGPRYEEHWCTVILLLLCVGCVCMWLCVGLGGTERVGGVHGCKEDDRQPLAVEQEIA